jgi:hypothetical protein
VRFEFEHRYAAPPDEVAAAYADPRLYEALVGLPKMEVVEVLGHQVDGTTVQLRVRSRYVGDLPGAADKVLDRSRLTWVEHSTHELSQRRVTFRLDADHYRNRLKASGSYRFEADGGGTTRRSDGEVRVSYPLVGRSVERALVSGLDEHLDSEVPVVERWIRQAKDTRG